MSPKTRSNSKNTLACNFGKSSSNHHASPSCISTSILLSLSPLPGAPGAEQFWNSSHGVKGHKLAETSLEISLSLLISPFSSSSPPLRQVSLLAIDELLLVCFSNTHLAYLVSSTLTTFRTSCWRLAFHPPRDTQPNVNMPRRMLRDLHSAIFIPRHGSSEIRAGG